MLFANTLSPINRLLPSKPPAFTAQTTGVYDAKDQRLRCQQLVQDAVQLRLLAFVEAS